MPVYDSVEQALQMIRDPEVLARVASVILQREYFNELVMSGTTGDCGRDARAQKGLWGDEYVVVQYSLADRWTRKVDRELRRYDTDPSLPKFMVYVTHRTTSYDAVRRKQEQALREHGVTLRVYDRGWLTLRLEREYRDVAEEHLGVRPRLPDRFVDVPTRRRELQRRVVGFAAPLVESDALRTLAAWMKPSDRGPAGSRVAVLVGPGGAGKTRASLESVPAGVPSVVLQAAQRLDRDAVGALTPSAPGILVIDDAHRITDLSGLRLLLDDGSWRGWRTILTLRPGYVNAVLEGAGLELDETTVIEFAGLTRPESAQLLAGEPYRIAAPDVANHLMRLATGSPLLLHLAGQAAAEGRLSSQGQAELLRSYAHRLMRTLPSGLHEDLVVICALLGKLALPDQLPIIRHLHPTAALPDVRSALADVADAGLGVFSDDVFTIQPDAIAPVIVLDGLLRTAAVSRLRLSDIPLPEDQDLRSVILPTFAAAVVYGDGWGADALRRFALRLPAQDLSWSRVLAILREARVYARALPTEANRVLQTVIRLHRDALLGHPSLLDAAADTVSELAQVDLRLALPTLLSLVEVESAAGAPGGEGPRATLAKLIEQSPTSFPSPLVTTRAVTALEVTEAWLGSEPESVERQRIVLMVAMMLIATIYEWMGTSAEDAMSIQFGPVPAPETTEHRRTVRGAAQLAAALIEATHPSALGELSKLYPALLHRAAGMSPMLNGPLPRWHQRTLEDAVRIVRRALLAHWDRLPMSVRLGCLQHDRHRQMAARAAADPVAERFAALLGVTRAGRGHAGQWEARMRRAHALGAELSPDQALDLSLQALALSTDRLRPAGIHNLLIGAGQHATRSQARRAILRMRGDPALAGFLSSLLAGVMQGPGLAPSLLSQLAGDPETAPHLAAVLDLVPAEQEHRLVGSLMAVPPCHAALADHLRTCQRLDAPTRAGLLLELAEATSNEQLPQVLEQFGTIDFSVPIPVPQRPRFLVQMRRAVAVSALDRSEPATLADAYAMVVGWGDDAWLEILEARRSTMLKLAEREMHRWELVPDDLTQGLHAITETQREAGLVKIVGWADDAAGKRENWRVAAGIEELVSRIAGTAQLADVLAGWYAHDAARRDQALRVLSAIAGRSGIDIVLEAILALSPGGTHADIVAALVTPPMDWAGELEGEYTRRAELLRSGRHGNKRFTELIATAIGELERLAAQERERIRRRREGFDES